MKRRSYLVTGLAFLSAAGMQTLVGHADPVKEPLSSPRSSLKPQTAQKRRISMPGRLPLAFESNQGQTDARVRFLSRSGDSTLFLTPSEAVFSMPLQARSQEQSLTARSGKKGREAARTAYNALRMQMVGADPKAAPLTRQPLAGQINYLVGSASKQWHTGIPTFGQVGFHGVYPGVDLLYYGNPQKLEYDFVVAPHADPGRIKLSFAGADKVRINAEGSLVVRTQGQELRWQKPTVYQQGRDGRRSVAARFQLKHLPNGQARVSFALGRYDHRQTLIIDPVLIYSTYLGGSGSPVSGSPDRARAIAVDSSGNAYITGEAWSSDFPTTPGAYQTTFRSLFVSKLNATGTALLYSTYIGGTLSGRATARGIAVDSGGNAYVTGDAADAFPTTPGALQSGAFIGGQQPFVFKLNPTGTALVYSTLLGGGNEMEYGSAITIDSSGNAYIAGITGSTSFPTTPGAFQQTFDRTLGSAAFLVKLNPTGTAQIYSTLLGGLGDNQARSVVIDKSGYAYVAGTTNSHAFPVTPGAYQTVNHASGTPGYNNFVAKFDPTGSTLLYSTYIGGSAKDIPAGIAIDSGGNAYITGVTNSKDYPITPGAFQAAGVSNYTDYANCFVTKLNPTGTALVYSTLLTGTTADLSQSVSDLAGGIVVDSAGNAYVAGGTHTTDFPTTIGAQQRTGGAFFTKINAAGTHLLYSTCLGTGIDFFTALALGPDGNFHVAGLTFSAHFPTTPGAFQTTTHAGNGQADSFVAKMSIAPVFPDFNADGKTDLLLQNVSTGAIISWFMQGTNWGGGAYFSQNPTPDQTLMGVGDFGGANLGVLTLVFQSKNTNQVVYWYTGGTNPATVTGGDFVNVTPQIGWKLAGIGDFNGDGRSDLLFQNQTTGQVAIWFMKGPYYQGGVLLPYTPLAGWKVAGVGDFNADGAQDIVFQNENTGQLALWYMNGTTYLGGTVLTTVPAAGWKVASVGDYNGDGSADLVFQNPNSSQTVIWYLKGDTFVGGSAISQALPSGWQIVGPR